MHVIQDRRNQMILVISELMNFTNAQRQVWAKQTCLYMFLMAHFYCHEIYRVEAVGLQNFQLYFKKYNFCEYVKLGEFLEKSIFWPITAELKFESENFASTL